MRNVRRRAMCCVGLLPQLDYQHGRQKHATIVQHHVSPFGRVLCCTGRSLLCSNFPTALHRSQAEATHWPRPKNDMVSISVSHVRPHPLHRNLQFERRNCGLKSSESDELQEFHSLPS